MGAPPPASLTFAGALTLAEFERLQRAILPAWSRWYFTVPTWVVLVLCVVGLPTDPAMLAVDVAGIGVVLLAAHFFVRHVRARTWRQAAQVVGRVHGAITPEGIEWNTDRSASRYEWARISELRRTGDLILAFYAPRCAFYFPRSFFASDADWAAFDAAITAYAGK